MNSVALASRSSIPLIQASPSKRGKSFAIFDNEAVEYPRCKYWMVVEKENQIVFDPIKGNDDALRAMNWPEKV